MLIVSPRGVAIAFVPIGAANASNTGVAVTVKVSVPALYVVVPGSANVVVGTPGDTRSSAAHVTAPAISSSAAVTAGICSRLRLVMKASLKEVESCVPREQAPRGRDPTGIIVKVPVRRDPGRI